MSQRGICLKSALKVPNDHVLMSLTGLRIVCIVLFMPAETRYLTGVVQGTFTCEVCRWKKKNILRACCDWWLREIRLQWLKRAYWYLIHIHRAQNTSLVFYYLSPHMPCCVGPGILRTNTENKTSFIVLKDVLFPLKRGGEAAENWVSRSPSITWHVGQRHLCCESARLGHRLGLSFPKWLSRLS